MTAPDVEALQAEIEVLRARLATIHDAAQRNWDEMSYHDDCHNCKRLEFIIKESQPDQEEQP